MTTSRNHINLIKRENLEGLVAVGLTKKDFKDWNKKMENVKKKIYEGNASEDMVSNFYHGMQAFYIDFKLTNKDTTNLIRLFNVYRDKIISSTSDFLEVYYSVGEDNLEKSIKYREKIKNDN